MHRRAGCSGLPVCAFGEDFLSVERLLKDVQTLYKSAQK